MRPKFGPTGKYPDGTIGPQDEGELQFGIAHDSKGRVHFNFGTPVASFTLSQEQAISLARHILRHCGVRKVEITLE